MGDSELIINQMNGTYRVRAENMISVNQDCQELASMFESIHFRHVLRDQNAYTDKLAQKAFRPIDVIFE